MNAPPAGLSPEEFRAHIDRYVAEHYEKLPDGYGCKRCGSRIQQTTCWVSIHAAEFSDTCAGEGEVKHIPLPYCPECEGKPKEVSTCVHVPLFAAVTG